MSISQEMQYRRNFVAINSLTIDSVAFKQIGHRFLCTPPPQKNHPVILLLHFKFSFFQNLKYFCHMQVPPSHSSADTPSVHFCPCISVLMRYKIAIPNVLASFRTASSDSLLICAIKETDIPPAFSRSEATSIFLSWRPS